MNIIYVDHYALITDHHAIKVDKSAESFVCGLLLEVT